VPRLFSPQGRREREVPRGINLKYFGRENPCETLRPLRPCGEKKYALSITYNSGSASHCSLLIAHCSVPVVFYCWPIPVGFFDITRTVFVPKFFDALVVIEIQFIIEYSPCVR